MNKRRKLGVALKYDGYNCPTVAGSGAGEVALEMRRTALRYGVPIRKRDQLASDLSEATIDTEIPYESYEEVARLFCDLDDVE